MSESQRRSKKTKAIKKRSLKRDFSQITATNEVQFHTPDKKQRVSSDEDYPGFLCSTDCTRARLTDDPERLTEEGCGAMQFSSPSDSVPMTMPFLLTPVDEEMLSVNNSGIQEEFTPFAYNFEPTASLMTRQVDTEELQLNAMLFAWSLLEYPLPEPPKAGAHQEVLNPETGETDFELSPGDFESNA